MSGFKDIDRRSLLAGLGAASVAAGAGKALAQEAQGQPLHGNPNLPEAPGDRMGWAIVGLGTYAVGNILPFFDDARHARMTAFVSGNPDKARRLGASYGVDQFYTYDTYDDIARDDTIDCVYIALPVGLHAEYTIRALEAGKHVLCEKPMASTPAEAQAMVDAAKAANRQLGIGYRVHFEGANLEAKRRLEAGELGPIRHIRSEHGFQASLDYRPHIWRLSKELGGGGSMYDIGVYGINTSLMMLDGDRPVEASGIYVYPREDPRFREVEGGVDWRLLMESGVVVSGSSSYCYSPYQSQQHYMGDKAAMRLSPATTYDRNILYLENGDRAQEVGTQPALRQFGAQLDGFSLAARNNTPHRTPGEMGLRDMRIIAAIYESADQGGAAVKL